MQKKSRITFFVAAIFFVVTFYKVTNAVAVNASFLATSDDGSAVEDAVVSLAPMSGDKKPDTAAPSKMAVMDQWQKQFIPYVLPIKVGTSVVFPNKDHIKHHVYSFSPTKPFELRLYSGVEAKPVLFDKPGIVTLGCNIHDWMLGFIDVLETDYFALTGANGKAEIKNVPPGEYIASVWQPNIKGDPAANDRKITIGNTDPGRIDFKISLKPDRRRPAPEDLLEGVPYRSGR